MHKKNAFCLNYIHSILFRNNQNCFPEKALLFVYFCMLNLKVFRIFLYLVAIHTFCVGIGLIFMPLDIYGFFGFEGYQGNFFKIQAGVFHLVMCGAYIPAAINPQGNRSLLLFAVFAKFTATVFLISYSLFRESIWMVLFSGIFDFLMGLVILWFYLRLIRPGVEK